MNDRVDGGSTAVIYVAGVDAGFDEARAAGEGVAEVLWLSRRGVDLGWLGKVGQITAPPGNISAAWRADKPVVLPGFVGDEVRLNQDHIRQAHALMEAVLDGEECDDLLAQPPHAERLAPCFELLSGIHDEGDDQEIVKVEFDVMDGDTLVAENIWVKLSWLSFEDEDASLRFRFSFGMEAYEDVAADFDREVMAAELAEAVFPESAIISANPRLAALLQQALDLQDIRFVERIVYFNAPDGGAQFHQDVERGHLGVVFAQLSGRTAWLALSKAELVAEIQAFIAGPSARQAFSGAMPGDAPWQVLLAHADNPARLSAWLDEPDNGPLEALLNCVPEFVRHLADRGHAYVLEPGDVMLLPQQDQDHCAWHSVFCIGDVPGEALSFAVRGKPA